MLTYLRYALATICFALSVACLGLWWSSSHYRELHFPTSQSGIEVTGYAGQGMQHIFVRESKSVKGWRYASHPMTRRTVVDLADQSEGCAFGLRTVGATYYWGFFPLWYPALVFALTGFATLRLGSRFTIRSAIIATTVVAGLLGMVVAC